MITEVVAALIWDNDRAENRPMSFSQLVSFRGKTAGIEGREIGGATQYEFSLSI